MDLVIPETHYVTTERLQALGTWSVCSFDMLSAVQLDHPPLLRTEEVGNRLADRRLPTKFEATELAVAQTLPEQRFNVGRVTAQSPCMAIGPPEAHSQRLNARQPSSKLR